MAQRYWRSGYVYFVQAEGNGLIKIGFTDREPMKRFAGLQAASPVPLVHLGIMWGGRDLEARLHQKFADLRSHGEWFRPGDRLVYMIRRWARSWTPDLLEWERKVQTPALRWFGPDRG